jgi:hypothetical protein
MKVSGKRKTFKTGAHRDEDPTKPALELISPFAEERLGVWLGQAAQRYGVRNWEKGMPVSRCFASLKRHVNKVQQGKVDEDHLSAIMCNAMMMIHTQEMVKRGVLPKELDDMPGYPSAEGLLLIRGYYQMATPEKPATFPLMGSKKDIERLAGQVAAEDVLAIRKKGLSRLVKEGREKVEEAHLRLQKGLEKAILEWTPPDSLIFKDRIPGKKRSHHAKSK